MTAAAVSSLYLQSRWSMPVVAALQRFDPRLSAPLNADDAHGFAWLMLLTTAFTTACWLVITYLTPPESAAKLQAFYDKVQPASAGWSAFAAGKQSRQSLRWATVDWVVGCAMIYGALFGIGYVVFGRVALGIVLLACAAACAGFIFWDLERRGWESLMG